ncbi:MAG: hypothetical protein J5755_05990, partial [Clostridia bacterium]|nr:hypothetical protein [Clostridia bacterium]
VDDAVSGWHYNAYWDEAPLGTLGQDAEGFYHCSSWDVVDMGVDATSTVSNTWLYRDMNEWEWTGGENSVGVRDQLRSSQYTYQYFSDTDDSQVFIDWNEHTMYNRSRFVIVLRDDTQDSYLFSPWSDIAAYGKDAETVEPLAPGDVPAPVITGLRLSDEQFNDNPVVAFTLTVPEDLATKAAQLAARNDIIRVEVEARVAGTSEWTNLNVGGNVTTGELEAALVYLAQPGNPLPDGTQVELRARYLVMQQGRDDFYSAYSKIIGFGSDEIVDHGSSGEHAGESGGEEGGGSILDRLPKSDCKVCHICPVQPLGICLFIWIAIAVAVVIVAVIVVIIIKKVKQNKDRNNQ